MTSIDRRRLFFRQKNIRTEDYESNVKIRTGPGGRCERGYADEMAKPSPSTFGGTWNAPRYAGVAAKGGELYCGNALYRRLTAVIPLKPA